MRSSIKIVIVAGEPSGDRIGELLAKALLKKDPALELSGLGGARMKEAGVGILEDITQWALIGLFEVFKNYFKFRKIFRRACRHLDEVRPAAVVLIDFPGFNLKLAREARRRGLRVIYYVSPQVWAWGKGRVRKISATVDRMMVILPFEKDFYEKEGVAVDFVGHPLVDFYQTDREEESFQKDFSQSRPLVAILPGSRSNEIRHHLNTLIEAACFLRRDFPQAGFVIPCATDEIYRRVCEEVRGMRGMDFIQASRNALKHCVLSAELAWVCSGTATLEVAYLGLPMIVFYKISPLTAFLIRRLIRVPFVGLVNLVAGRPIAPELLQENFQARRLADLSERFLSNGGGALHEMREALKEVKTRLGGPGASDRAADIILEEIHKDNTTDNRRQTKSHLISSF